MSTYVRKKATPHVVHWPKLDAFGNVMAACSNSGGYYARLRLTKTREEITCQRCQGKAGVRK